MIQQESRLKGADNTGAKEELFNLRFQSATGQLEGHGRLRAVKRDIARIYTVLRERELGIRATPAPVETPAAAPKRGRGRKADTAQSEAAQSTTAAEVTAAEPAAASSETTEEKS